MTDFDKGKMFLRLSPDDLRAGEHGARAGEKDDYTPVIPVPKDAPDPDWHKLRPTEATANRPEDATTMACASGRRKAPPDSAALNAAALSHLPTLCVRWLPDGGREAADWVARTRSAQPVMPALPRHT